MVARISFGLLIATSLALSVYFGTMAWRITGDPQDDSTGRGPPFRLISPR
jgi:hypothetical protein